MSKRTAIEPTRIKDYPGWYQEIIRVAELAEHAPVRGCMIMKPYGYALWERIQYSLNQRFKKLGVQNAYFPLFIPLEFLEKEASHVEGFAKECAIVTHTRLEKAKDGKLHPAAPLEEPLIVRPTSETIIGASFAKWIESYRDLPLLINQWCNVVRWEMRPRLFLRTSEFLWQEGHTAHETKEEAQLFSKKILDLYVSFAKDVLAIPVIDGEKSEGERFPGALHTLTFEAMMQDGKALQMGTSHYMGTNFAEASSMRYLSKDGDLEYAHTTSWGVTTRLIGGVIMTHSDDNGCVLPPKIAPYHVVIIPVVMKEETRSEVLNYCYTLKEEIEKIFYFEDFIRVYIDERDIRVGEKSWDAVKKGYPLRIEIGPRDIKGNNLPLFFRTKEKNDHLCVQRQILLTKIVEYLDQLNRELYELALNYRKNNTIEINNLSEFTEIFKAESFPNQFVIASWGGDKALEAKIQKEHGVTIRCIPHSQPLDKKPCVFTKQPLALQAIFAKSY